MARGSPRKALSRRTRNRGGQETPNNYKEPHQVIRQREMTKKLLSVFLTVLLSTQAGLAGSARHTTRQPKKQTDQAGPQKVRLAPDLEELLLQDEQGEAGGKSQPARTLAQARRERLVKPARAAVGGVALPSAEVPADERQSFIVKLDDFASGAAMEAKLAPLGGRVSRQLSGMGLVIIEAPRNRVRQLAAEAGVAYISPDRPVASLSHVAMTVGAGAVRSAVNGLTIANGTGVGVALLDSGVDDTHNLIKPGNDHTGVALHKDFTGRGTTADLFGHGTHVASMLAGNKWYLTNGPYTGVAYDARVLDLRVLDEQGRGASSTTIAAIDWCVANKAAWNIRVINLSLGTPAQDSYKNDPLCQAARRAFNAGILVVAAAGNAGKDASGHKIYGGIHSPGIDPSVLTVGATNTFGTDARSDDVITTYSSRGPTRGFYTDAAGVRHYDNLIKPDIVAPGNRLIGACSTASRGNSNSLVNLYPDLRIGTAPTTADQMIYLSGTSMAAPIVAGAAALLFEARPEITPSLAKAILMYTAQPLNGANTFEQGAGELNVVGAVQILNLLSPSLPTLTNGAAMLTAALPYPQASSLFGETIYWSQGVITNYGFLYGGGLMTSYQAVYGSGV